jgi:hypothetical protein
MAPWNPVVVTVDRSLCRARVRGDLGSEEPRFLPPASLRETKNILDQAGALLSLEPLL